MTVRIPRARDHENPPGAGVDVNSPFAITDIDVAVSNSVLG